MAIDLEQVIIKEYDDLLDKLPHISSLKINYQGFEQCLASIYNNRKYNNEEIEQAHNNLIGNIVFSNILPDYIDAKTYIVYPHFHVNTYYPNPAYIHYEQNSIEKSIIIAKKQELNMNVIKRTFKGPLSFRFMQVLNIQRIIIEPGVSYYKLQIRYIPNETFYTFYNKLVAGKDIQHLSNDEFNWYKNKAIHDSLLASSSPSDDNTLEGEYILYDDNDYEMLKTMIKNKYGVSFNDNFISIDGEEKSMWLSLGIEKFDNRVISSINGKDEIIPLNVQKQLNKKIDQIR